MKRLFLLLALCGMVAVGCTEGGVDDNIDNGGNNTEQPGEDDDDENKEDDAIFITDSKGNVVVEAEGGEVVVTVTTDIEYSVEIPKEAQSWLSVADTRAIRMEKLTFTVADNDTFEERSANVELVDSDGMSLQTIKFLQRASDKVFEIDDEGKYIIEAQGGVIEVDVTTNLEYDVIIPDEALAWISLAGTRAVREETLTLNIAKNEGSEERSATLNLCAKGGDILQTITIKQNKPTTISCANNEIIYTTKYGYPIELNTTDGFGGNIMSHNYANGYGRISFDNDVVSIPNKAFNGCTTLTTIVLPNSLSTIDSSAFYGCTSLTSITIPDSVKSIGSEAFRNCTSLTSVTIGKGVTSIGKNAFYGCTGELIVNCNIPSATYLNDGAFYGADFTKVTIGNSVTTIGDCAFYNCTSLTSVTIGNGVTEIGDSAFRDCTSLTSITIPDSVTEIGERAFLQCLSLTEFQGKFAADGGRCLIIDRVLKAFAFGCGATEYTIPDSVKSIGSEAFHNCTSLTSVTIGKGVTSIGKNAFYGCTGELIVNCNIPSASSYDYGAFRGSKFTQVTIGDSVTSIGSYAFSDCDSLTSVYITDIAAWCNISFGGISSNPLYYAENLYLNNELVTDLIIPDGAKKIGSYAFYGYYLLTSVTIPNSVTSIGKNAFYDCDSLTSVTIGNGVTSIGDHAFYDCTGELIVNCNIPSASSYDYGAFYGSKFTQVTIGDSVTSIGDYAFYDRYSLKSVTIGNGVTSIGDYAFCYCDSLTSITIPDSVTSIGDHAFLDCDSLTSVTIGNGVTEIGKAAFDSCGSLASVYITDIAAWCKISFVDYDSNPLYYAENLYLNNELVTDLIIPDGATKIGDHAFHDCTSLTSITIPDSVTSIGKNAFYDCDSLTSVTIGNGVTSIGDHAFYDCTGELIVNCNIPSASSYDYGAFYGSKFTQVTIGDSVTSIGDYAFYDRYSLKSVTIGNGVTSIGSYAFYACDSLKSVTIGKGVTSIGSYAFVYCYKLQEVYCKPTTPPTGGSSMFEYNASGRKIYVPRNSVSAYKSAGGWSDYASDIVGYDF